MSFIYSIKEIRRRREVAQERMRKQRLDALLITNVLNFIYFVGLSGAFGLHHSNDRPAVAVLPAEGEPEPICVVAGNQESDVAPVLKHVNIATYTSTLGVPNDILVSALRRVKLRSNRIGIEEGLAQRISMPYGEYRRLLGSFPDVNFVDAAPLIWGMRMVKSEEEIAYMRKAADATAKGRQETFDEIESGMTYREVARLLSQNMIRAGADKASFIAITSSSQDHMDSFNRHMDLIPDKRIKQGEAVYIDAGAYVYVYTVDYNRYAILGKATARVKKYHRIAKSVSDKMAEAIKPGATCADIFRVAVRELKKNDAFPEYVSAGRMGHGQGMLFTEPPSVTSSDHTVLEPGLVVSTEPMPIGEGIHYVWEDTWVVRNRDGPELLTKETTELREIGR